MFYVQNESIPNCVPEYYRSMFEPDHDPEIDERNAARWESNRQNVKRAREAGLCIFCFGECEKCYECTHADNNTEEGPEDDSDAIICRREGGPCEEGRRIWNAKYA